MNIRKPISMEIDLSKCDRCGLEQSAPATPKIITLSSFNEKQIDLCVPCAQAVKAFIQAGP